MELTHEFEVPVPPDRAYEVLTDVERVAPCMPGATVDEVDGDDFSGSVKVKVGPIQMTYRGTATFTSKDPENHSATIEAKGRETRGSGTATATIHATMTAKSTEVTAVTVHTDLAVTGRPAQFGRGVLKDVGDKLLGMFADCLADELRGVGAAAASGPDEDVGDGPPPAPADAGTAAADGGHPDGAPVTAAGHETARAQPSTADAAAATPAATAAPPVSQATAAGGAAAVGAAAASTSVTGGEPPAGASGEAAAGRERPSDDAIDLLDVAGASVAKRAVPVALAVAVLVALIWWLVSRGDD